MTSTARRWECPIDSSRWCRCILSGENGDRPLRVRRMTASSRSMNGMTSTAIGTSSGRASGSRLAAESKDCASHSPGGGDRRGREHQPDQHRAGVAHEDPGRAEVVRQEAQAGAGQHRGDQRGGARDVVVAGQAEVVGVGEEGQRGDRRDPGRQPVQPVDEVDRVDREHGHAGWSAGRRCRARTRSCRRRRPAGRGRQLDAEQHHHAGRGDLAGQLGQRVQAPLVVERRRAGRSARRRPARA